MIIDIHTHCFADNLAARAVSVLSQKGNLSAFTNGTVKDLKSSMQHAGVNISVLQTIATKPEQTVTINRWAVSVQDNEIMSFGTLHPDFTGWREEIRYLAESGVRGIKLHPDYQSFFVDDSALFPIYEAVFNEGLIILFHAGIDIGLPEPCHCPPAKLRKVVDAFPGTRIIAAHMGGFRYWDDVERYLLGTGVYLDTSYSFETMGAASMRSLIKGHGVEKILFGTDSPWTDQLKEIENIRALGLSDAETGMILGGNAVRLLIP